MDRYYIFFSLLLDIILLILIAVIFYHEFGFEEGEKKMHEKLKKIFKIIKPVLIFCASFIIAFLILLIVRYCMLHAEEMPSTETDDNSITEISTSEFYTEDDVNDSELVTDEIDIQELEDSTEDSTTEPTIIVYEMPTEEVHYYSNLDDYINAGESQALTYYEYHVLETCKILKICLIFITAMEFIVMISLWRVWRS